MDTSFLCEVPFLLIEPILTDFSTQVGQTEGLDYMAEIIKILSNIHA